MGKERDKLDNSSYLFRLNQELSGQAELNPYYVISDETEIAEGHDTIQDGQLADVEDGPVLE